MSVSEQLYGQEHVDRYRETGGEVGHIWKEGSTILLLTTTGRTSGEPRTTPLIYATRRRPVRDRRVAGRGARSTRAGTATSSRRPRSSSR